MYIIICVHICRSFQDACFLNAFGGDGFFQDSCADNSLVPRGAATFIITSNFAAELLVLDEVGPAESYNLRALC